MRRQLVPALVLLAALTLLTGLVYPFAVTGLAQVAFPARADGSLIERDGRVVGSRVVGQAFTSPRYFHPRPSAAGYDGMASGPSNLGPTSPALLAATRARAAEYRALNGLPDDARIPIDALTASGSGLDPHVSPANARLQAPRVARVRRLPLDRVLALVDEHTDRRALGFLGEPGVDVVELNLALDTESR